MEFINEITVQGLVTKIMPIKNVRDKDKLLTFIVVTNDKISETKTLQEFHYCTCWNEFAIALEKDLKVGDAINLKGKIKTTKRGDSFSTEVKIREYKLLPKEEK